MEKRKLGRNPFEAQPKTSKITWDSFETEEKKSEPTDYKVYVHWPEFLEKAVYPGITRLSYMVLKKTLYRKT